MHPLGFESPSARLRRSAFIGLLTGTVAIALFAPLLFVAASRFNLGVVLFFFAVGSLLGFAARLLLPDYAPPQPRDGGDADAPVPARLVPPVSPLVARAAAPLPDRPTSS